jgi:hypothetical protein
VDLLVDEIVCSWIWFIWKECLVWPTVERASLARPW